MDLSKFGVEVKNDKPKEILDENLEIHIDRIKKDFKNEEIERYLPWFLKYQVKKFDDLIQTPEIIKISKFLENFKKGKGLLLYGLAGSGKTTTLTLLGEKFEYEIFELNASDVRNKSSLNLVLGDAIRQKSLFAKRKMILIDEVDGVSGTEDRGGVAELAKFVKESEYPIVFTANDGESEKIKSLKKVCEFINFENHSRQLLCEIAKKIFEKENISYEKESIDSFVEIRSTTDIRGFINDIQASVFEGKFEPDENLEIRDYKRQIENLLEKIYFSYPEDSYYSSFNTSIDLDELFLYIEENTPNSYSGNSLIQAFNEISKADIFRGRIRKWQYWRFLVYVNFYLTFGVSASKSSPKKFIVKRNSRILKKWIYGNKYASLRPRTKIEKVKDLPPTFLEKLSKLYGVSAKKCRSKDLFYFAFQYKNNEDFRSAMDIKLQIEPNIRKALLEL